ncbi:MAG: PKD domain-containing protein [Cytophagales bacterium]|nr:PKD domain-containing protein [Cytophagales bacterium]
MIFRIFLYTAILLFFLNGLLIRPADTFAQGCLLYEIPFQQKVQNSSFIIEGKVIDQHSVWQDHTNIYTIHTIEIYKIFRKTALKPQIKGNYIKLITPGGIVGNEMVKVYPSIELEIGDVGIFFLSRVLGIKNLVGLKGLLFEPYAGPQGFFRYNLENGSASSPFQSYENIDDLYQDIVPPSRDAQIGRLYSGGQKGYINIQKFNWKNNVKETKNNQKILQPVIVNFTPNPITAGTNSLLTITGSNFGASQGTGKVLFKDANYGGSLNTTPLSSQYISWTDTLIEVYVPTRAGTGTIIVQNGAGQSGTSGSILTVDYSQLNVVTGGVAYQPDHVDDNGTGGYTWQMHVDFANNIAAKGSFERALETWRCETFINWYVGDSTLVDAVGKDGINIVRFDNGTELPLGVLGVNYSFWSYCGEWYVDELDIVFNDGTNWQFGPALPVSGQYDFETVALHELGHGHQLGHIIASAKVMHYALGSGSAKRILDPVSDIAGGLYVMTQSTVANSCGPGPMNALNSSNCVINAPMAAFTVDFDYICPGVTVNFTDLSTNNPTSWSWSFPGGAPAASTAQNPSVTYSASGVYNVTLIVTNANGSDTLTETAYITVALPTGVLSGSATIIVGGSATLQVDLTGVPPWSITYFDGVTSTTINGITTTPYYFTVSPTDTTTYTLTAVSDSFCAGVASGSAVINVVSNLVIQTDSIGLFFDGTNDVVHIPYIPVYDLGTGDFTLEAWIKADPVQDFYPQILSNRNPTPGFPDEYTGFLLGLNTLGAPYMRLADVNYFITSQDVRDNTCHHIASVRSIDDTLKIYIDGQLAASTYAGIQDITTNDSLLIGWDDPAAWSTPFHGYIQEVRIWNIARTQQEIQDNMDKLLCDSLTGLIGYWRLNANSGQIVTDHSITGNDGYLGKTPGFDINDPKWQVSCPINNTCALVSCNISASFTVNDTLICDSTTLFFINTSINTTDYEWRLNAVFYDTSANVSITFDTAGVYTVTLIAKDSLCPDTFSKTITVLPNLIANAWADTTICLYDSVQLYASAGTSHVWIPSKGLNDTLIPNPIAKPDTTTTYKVIVSSTGCKADTAFVTVSVNSLPIVNAGTDMKICLGDSIQLSGSGGIFYYWNPTTGLSDSIIANPYAKPADTITYVLAVTDNNGCINTDSVTITVNILPIAAAWPDTVICQGESIQLNATGGTNYSWSPAIGLSNDTIADPLASPDTTTTWYVTVTDTNNCQGIDSLTISVEDTIAAFVTPDTTTCKGDSLMLSASGGTFYNWSPSSGLSNDTISNPIAVPDTTTSYMVIVSGFCPSDIAYVTVSVNPLPVVDAGTDMKICLGDSVQLTSSGGLVYNWSPGASLNDSVIANPIASPANTTTYQLTVRDSNSCAGIDSVKITVLPELALNVNPATICIGDSVVLIASGGQSYLWTLEITPTDTISTDSSITVSPADTTLYLITAFDSTCQRTDTVMVAINPLPVVYAYPDTTINPGASVQLNAGGGVSYLWSPGAGLSDSTKQNPVATPPQTTTWWVTVTDSNGCQNMASVTIIVTGCIPPIADFSFTDTNLTVIFSDSSLNAESLFWNFGDLSFDTATNPIHTYVDTGTYWVCLTAINSCGSYTVCDSITVTCITPAAYFGYTIDSNNLTVTFFDSSTNFITLYWNFDDGNTDNIQNPAHIYANPGSYNVCLTAINSCDTDTACRIVTLTVEKSLFIPSAFSPNGDDVNDRFKVIGKGIKSIYLAVYNRWGEKVYETSNVDEALYAGWDGKHAAFGGRRKEQGMTVFVYYLEVEFVDGTNDTRKGDVTLIR